MRAIMRKIEEKKSTLERSRFVEWLIREDVPGAEKLSFAPAMAFFIMGFRDILCSLKQRNPTTWAAKIVNQHCDEDADHWRWYIEDLEKLGFDHTVWGGDLSGLFSRMWSDETRESRNLVYLTMYHVRSAPSPEVLLVIIEVMEATFGVFSDALHRALQGMPAYSNLKYFGHTHRQEEESHAIGSWTQSGSHSEDIYGIQLPKEVREICFNIVDALFAQFQEVFEEWYLSKNSYHQHSHQNCLQEKVGSYVRSLM